MSFSDIVLLFISMIIFFEFITTEYDDTDNKEAKERSGLVLYTDYGTGLQYIKGGYFGDLIPRLDADGKHMQDPKYADK